MHWLQTFGRWIKGTNLTSMSPQNESSKNVLEQNLLIPQNLTAIIRVLPSEHSASYFSRWFKSTNLYHFWISTGGTYSMSPQNESPPKCLGAKRITSKPNSCNKSIASSTFGLLFCRSIQRTNLYISWMITINCILDSWKLLKKIIQFSSYMYV